MSTIFTVTTDDLDHLNPKGAVDVFRELIWAEATASDIGKDLISVPTAITVADGGIDAEVTDSPKAGGQGIIKQGLTRYQIKTGKFSLGNEANVKDILFTEGSSALKPRVKSCLDKGGTLVVVLFGWDNPDKTDDQYIKKFRDELIAVDAKYKTAKIEIWLQNKLLSFIAAFPSLALRVNGRGGARFQTHESWSQDAEMKKTFEMGKEQQDRITIIRDNIRSNEAGAEAIHIRIYGDAGIGKTRLVLEATREDDLRPSIIYCPSASQFKNSDLMIELLKEDNQFSATLVIDECNRDDRAYIWDKLKYRGSRIKLITIFNEYDDTVGQISYLEAPPLEDIQISNIIQGYGVAKERADIWEERCGGSPRVAHAIGTNLVNNPDDVLKPPDTVNLWERFIVGYDNPDDQLVKQRWVVLRYIALFKRFGMGAPLIAEARFISELVEKSDPQITWDRFREIVKNLKERRILQGENTLYITPKALHLFLWSDWWDTYGTGFNLDEFLKQMPEQLKAWFYEMFKYAAESKAASKIVNELLGDGGPFNNNEYIQSALGANFFLALTEAEPKTALKRLKTTLGPLSEENLYSFTTGRREVIWALERIAMHRDLFPDAARLLLALGEAENETWSNNASGVFAYLFSPAPGLVASTGAPPEERFPVLKEAIESPSKKRRLLALNACSAGLRHGHFARTVGAEYQGLKEVKLWTPKTWGEIFDAYRRVWELLYDKLDNMEEDEQQKAVSVLLDHTRSLASEPNLFDMVINTISELAGKPYVEKEELVKTIVQILHYDRKTISPELIARWEKLRDELVGSDYSSLLRRYAGMDLLEDQFDDEGAHIDQIQSIIEDLAQQAMDDINLLYINIEWLVITEKQNCARFGYALGNLNKDFSLLQSLTEAQKKAGKTNNITFLGGYFSALFSKNKQKWEEQLDLLVLDPELNKLVAELTWRSGLTDRAVLRMVELVKKGISDNSHFQMLRGNISGLSEGTITILAEFLLDCNDAYSISILLQLFDSYYIHGKSKLSLPEKITFRLLTHPSLLGKNEPYRRNSMDDFEWSLIAKKFITDHQERSLELAENMLERFEEEGSIVNTYSKYVMEIIDTITREYPHEIWKLITKFIGPPMDTRAWHITHWLRGIDMFDNTEGSLKTIPLSMIWEWVEEDIEKRARYLASFVPNRLFKEEGKICLAWELLSRYGNRQDVRNSFSANYSTGGWSGPASLHYETKKQQLLDFKKDEDNPYVQLWIDEYVDSLERDIKRERISEERED